MEEVVKKARELMYEQTKKNKAPAWGLTEIAIEKGEQLANQYHVDKNLVLISIYLQHTVFSRVYKGEIQKKHPQLSAEFSKKYLEGWGVSEEEQKVILNDFYNKIINTTSFKRYSGKFHNFKV